MNVYSVVAPVAQSSQILTIASSGETQSFVSQQPHDTTPPSSGVVDVIGSKSPGLNITRWSPTVRLVSMNVFQSFADGRNFWPGTTCVR